MAIYRTDLHKQKFTVTALTLLTLASFAFLTLKIRDYIKTKPAATTSNGVTLTLPSTASTTLGQTLSLPVTLTSASLPVRGVDLVIDFDTNILRLMDIIPSTMNFKTIAPIDTSGNFHSAQAVASANSAGRIELGLITYDWPTQQVTIPVTGSNLNLVTLRFQSLQSGSTTVSLLVSTPTVSTDSNVVSATNPPSDLLIDPNQATGSSVTILVPTSTPPPPPPAPTSELVINGGFETGNFSAWSYSGATLVNSGARTGVFVAQLSGNNKYLSQNIKAKLTAGVPYTFTAWVKVTTPGTSWGYPVFRLSKYADMGSNTFGEAKAQNSATLGWQQLRITKTFTQADLTNSAIYLGIRSFGFTGTVLSDDISGSGTSQQTPTPPVILPTNTPTPQPTATPSPTRTPTPLPPTSTPTSVPSPTPTLPPTQDLIIINGDFESGSTNWSFVGATLTTTNPHAGVQSVSLTANNSSVSQNIKSNLTAAVTYTFTAWVKVTALGTSWGFPSLRLSKYSDLGSSDFGTTSAQNSTASGWQKLTLTKTFNTSELSNNIFVGIKHFGFTGNSLVDDITVTAAQ